MSYNLQGSIPYLTVGSKTNANYITDGSADEVQIIAAIEKAEGEGGGIVFLQPGAFSVDDIIDFSDAAEVYLTGSGRGVTNLTATASLGAADPMFYITSSGNHIERMSVDMSDEGDNCIEGYGAANNWIQDVVMTNVTQDGIHLTSAAESNSNKIFNNTISQPGRYGIFIDNEVGHSWINGNVVSDQTGASKVSTAGFYFGWGGQQTCTQNVIWGLEVAVLIAGSVNRFQWNNNIMTGNWTDIEINGENNTLQFNDNLFWDVGLGQVAAAGDQNSCIYFNSASGQYGVTINNNIANSADSARAAHFIHCTSDNILRGTMSGNSARDFDDTVYDIGTQGSLVTTGANHNN